jgi:type IV secretory pathway VirB4 component
VAKRPEALLGDKIPLEDHIADDVVLTRGNGVLAMFSADGVFPDTADDTDIAAWFDRLHNALKNIAAEDVELTVYQCRGEADPSGYQAGPHHAPFARELDAAYRDSLFRGLLYSNRLFVAVQLHPPNVAAQSVVRFLADTGTDPRAGINERKNRLTEICDLLQAQLGLFVSWYLQHQSDLKQKLAACNGNPGAAMTDVECQNAAEAKSQIDMDEFQGKQPSRK